ncbi:MAG: neutral zinc metallopeptidase [Proteobacteria bacterium]|nr:neutral zinc metallopeptidase [Pseudomonadota bacterium]
MRWRNRRQSGNMIDRRGSGGGMRMGGLRMGSGMRRGGGAGALVLVAIVVVALIMGIDPMTILDPQGAPRPVSTAGQDELRDFAAVVLADTEDVWEARFQAQGRDYTPVPIVLYTARTTSGCGLADSAIGPFYCPQDRRIYLDLGFFDQLERGLGAGGDFARAYVIGHEVGHHVQNLMGVLGAVQQRQAGLPESEANALSVRLELQADCLAGIWSHDAEQVLGVLEPGDIEEALGAASRIGDDALQQRGQGHVVPDSFTHGTSAQRMRWFRRGYDSGDITACDSFAAETL